MMLSDPPPRAAIRNIFHPSDFSKASEQAFHHALKLALASGAAITVLHVTDDDDTRWSKFPGVRHWLERWRLIPPGSGRDAVAGLGLAVNKVIAHTSDAVRACRHFIEKHPTELIVLGTQERHGRGVWSSRPVGEPVGREAGQMTLLLPEKARGFVNADDGSVHLRHIVVPISHKPNPQTAVNAAARIAATLGVEEAVFHLVHVGARDSVPAVRLPPRPGWVWECDVREGPVVEEILDAAEEYRADLLVMSTDSHEGFLDSRGDSKTERILREAPCPLLAVPGHAGD